MTLSPLPLHSSRQPRRLLPSMENLEANADSDKMVRKIEERDQVRQTCRKWYWIAINFLPPAMITTGFILFPPVLQQESQHSRKSQVGIGIAFALVASGFVPMFLLPFSALRPRISTLANKLCLTAGLFGILNIAINLVYGLGTSDILVTALVLAVSQFVCFGAIVWLRCCWDRKGMSLGTKISGGDPIERLKNLQITDNMRPAGEERFHKVRIVIA